MTGWVVQVLVVVPLLVVAGRQVWRATGGLAGLHRVTIAPGVRASQWRRRRAARTPRRPPLAWLLLQLAWAQLRLWWATP